MRLADFDVLQREEAPWFGHIEVHRTGFILQVLIVCSDNDRWRGALPK
jgi:hypothetical protein